jgi:hypothetical protein
MRPALPLFVQKELNGLVEPSIRTLLDDSFVAVNVASKTKELSTFLSRDWFFVIETEQDGTTFQ